MNSQDLPEAPRITLVPNEVTYHPKPEPQGDTDLELLRCQGCSGFHVTNCWSIREVEFFPGGGWSKIKLDPRPQAEANTVYDFEEIKDVLGSPSQD